MQETLQEITNTPRRDVRIDSQSGILFGVKIIGCQSRNGREYPNDTLREAIALYENSKVNLDHPEGDPRKPRSYQDRFGMIRNVTLRENDGLYADFHFNPHHAVAEQLLWDAQNAPENVGFSHNVEALVRREDDRVIVEKILAVRSVDLVADPATTAGLFEALSKTSKEYHQDTPICPADKPATKQNPLIPFCKALLHECRSLIPCLDTVMDDRFLTLLSENEDSALTERLIEDRLRLLEKFRTESIVETKPVSREQFVPETTFDAKSFAKNLKK